MNISLFIGTISLNCSFILYLIVYLPQVYHNRKSQHLAEMSLAMHYLLLASYFFDLFYGFLYQLQWQYKLVSMVGLSLVSIQHIQLTCFLFKANQFVKVVFNGIMLFGYLCCICLFFTASYPLFNTPASITVIGALARVCGLLYCLPQLVQNRTLQSAEAISVSFIYLNISLAMLDTTSAWCLNWGWPNKLSSPISAVLMLMLLRQYKQYKQRPSTSTWDALPYSS